MLFLSLCLFVVVSFEISTFSCTSSLCSNFGDPFALYLLPCLQEKTFFHNFFLKLVPVEKRRYKE